MPVLAYLCSGGLSASAGLPLQWCTIVPVLAYLCSGGLSASAGLPS